MQQNCHSAELKGCIKESSIEVTICFVLTLSFPTRLTRSMMSFVNQMLVKGAEAMRRPFSLRLCEAELAIR
jgi:hypothetical protein